MGPLSGKRIGSTAGPIRSAPRFDLEASRVDRLCVDSRYPAAFLPGGTDRCLSNLAGGSEEPGGSTSEGVNGKLDQYSAPLRSTPFE